MGMRRWTILACLLVALGGGCHGRGYRPLMPTAVLYADLEVDLFSYMAEEKQTPTVEVSYATHRQRQLTSDCDVIVMASACDRPSRLPDF